jgi:hypothetical protein
MSVWVILSTRTICIFINSTECSFNERKNPNKYKMQFRSDIKSKHTHTNADVILTIRIDKENFEEELCQLFILMLLINRVYNDVFLI